MVWFTRREKCSALLLVDGDVFHVPGQEEQSKKFVQYHKIQGRRSGDVSRVKGKETKQSIATGGRERGRETH